MARTKVIVPPLSLSPVTESSLKDYPRDERKQNIAGNLQIGASWENSRRWAQSGRQLPGGGRGRALWRQVAYICIQAHLQPTSKGRPQLFPSIERPIFLGLSPSQDVLNQNLTAKVLAIFRAGAGVGVGDAK